MLNLKSAYFYFLAAKINLIKKIKKIYFTTLLYNNSLKTKTPEQLYFYPNSFLLSSFTNYKNFSFQVSSIDPEMFWEKQPTKQEERNLNNFLWLNLIDRKNDGSVIQKIITVWIYNNSKYKSTIWESSIISKRIISWILNSDIILNNTDNVFRNNYLESIIIQTNHLKKNIKFENDYSKKIEIISAILLTGLVFKEYEENFAQGLRDLEKLTNIFFDEGGFPINRSSDDLIKFSKHLILIKECIKEAQQLVPEFLDEIIEKNLVCIKSIITPQNHMPLFNGATESNIENNLEGYLKYIESLNYKFSKIKIKNKIGGLQIMKSKKCLIYFDTGKPPKKNFSSEYQSAPLAFELFVENEKIITNCGFGKNISQKAILLSRLTSAQSTLSLNDTSVAKFERNKSLNSAFGYSLKNSFKIFNHDFKEDQTMVETTAAHDAYEKIFGYNYKRKLLIEKTTNSIYGFDTLSKKIENTPATYNIRFHLYPGITAVQTISGKSILIQVKKNKSLIFTAENENVRVEKSIFLGRNKILNNLCITISGKIADDKKIINWEIKRNT